MELSSVPRGRGTRLLARGSGGAVGLAAFDLPHFVMEQKMLRGIRDRAEQTRRGRATTLVHREYYGGRGA
jgi:hypothetical protein